MFEIKKLSVIAEGRDVVKDVSLTVRPGEIHAIMGPNGAGKSSFAEALMGHPALKVKGSIRLDSKELGRLSPDERAKRGLFLAFQHPEEIEGVGVGKFIRRVRAQGDKDLDQMMQAHRELVSTAKGLGLDESFVSRDINVGFSGGEKKRLEILQLIALKPRIIILDEVDSGLDVDGIKLISKAISRLNDGTRSFIIITHYPRILKYIKPDAVHVMVKGRIVASGDERLAHEIEEKGYSSYAKD